MVLQQLLKRSLIYVFVELIRIWRLNFNFVLFYSSRRWFNLFDFINFGLAFNVLPMWVKKSTIKMWSVISKLLEKHNCIKIYFVIAFQLNLYNRNILIPPCVLYFSKYMWHINYIYFQLTVQLVIQHTLTHTHTLHVYNKPITRLTDNKSWM